jgi:uncharacterized YigZ family protein
LTDAVWVPAGEGQAEITERKSRFLGMLLPADSPEAVRETVKQLKDQHPQARHVVHAFVLGDDGSRIGFSDDGEPHGTSGRPVFDVLKGSGLVWAALYIVRWFGGIKLGTGGLVSAYSRCAAETVAATPRREKITLKDFALTLSYPQHQRLREYLPGIEGTVVSEDFSEGVKMVLQLPAVHEEAFRDWIRELGRGSLVIETGKDQQ